MTDNELETRASLESALVLLRRLGQLEHAEDCDHYNACQNADCECPEDDDGCVTHETASCSCLVSDAATMARNIGTVLARTMPKAAQMPSSARDDAAWAKLNGDQIADLLDAARKEARREAIEECAAWLNTYEQSAGDRMRRESDLFTSPAPKEKP